MSDILFAKAAEREGPAFHTRSKDSTACFMKPKFLLPLAVQYEVGMKIRAFSVCVYLT
jgi:hypothetical protein